MTSLKEKLISKQKQGLFEISHGVNLHQKVLHFYEKLLLLKDRFNTKT